jgi:pyruvate formate-lyase activating enzyme-like uncharacterized protein
VAKAHFTVRRLKQSSGEELIQQLYTETVNSNAENKRKVVPEN